MDYGFTCILQVWENYQKTQLRIPTFILCDFFLISVEKSEYRT